MTKSNKITGVVVRMDPEREKQICDEVFEKIIHGYDHEKKLGTLKRNPQAFDPLKINIPKPLEIKIPEPIIPPKPKSNDFNESCGCFIISLIIVGIGLIAINLSGHKGASNNSSYKSNVNNTAPAPAFSSPLFSSPSSSIYEEPVQSSSYSRTPEDAYEEGYNQGYEHGQSDGLKGLRHGYSYDESSNYYNHYETCYIDGYVSGYEDGYSSGFSEYEEGE